MEKGVKYTPEWEIAARREALELWTNSRGNAVIYNTVTGRQVFIRDMNDRVIGVLFYD